jgi:hypothetical protein
MKCQDRGNDLEALAVVRLIIQRLQKAKPWEDALRAELLTRGWTPVFVAEILVAVDKRIEKGSQ